MIQNDILYLKAKEPVQQNSEWANWEGEFRLNEFIIQTIVMSIFILVVKFIKFIDFFILITFIPVIGIVATTFCSTRIAGIDRRVCLSLLATYFICSLFLLMINNVCFNDGCHPHFSINDYLTTTCFPCRFSIFAIVFDRTISIIFRNWRWKNSQ